jgi:hypothetical protein
VRALPPAPPHSLGVVSIALWALLGCGGGGTRPVTHADFRAVQRAEADVAKALPIATAAEGACEASCEAASEICASAGAICDLARETEDLDLRARCRGANDRCQSATGRSDARCACTP